MKRLLLPFAATLILMLLSGRTHLSAQCTNPSINLPDQQTPVDGNPANAYCVTFTFDPSSVGLPLSLTMELEHSWQGDLSIFVNACGNTLNIMQRPGVAGSCTGGCPCGNSSNIGSQGNPVPVTFSDSGVNDPENGIASGGGTYGITSDDGCGIGTPGIDSFADLWAACPPGQDITAEVCIGDHAFADDGVAQNVTLDFPNPVVCGCTDPNAPNYDPNATVDDGSCLPVPCTVNVSLPGNQGICSGNSLVLMPTVTNAQGTPTYSWSATNNGLTYLDNPNLLNPTVTLPQGFSGSITYTITVTDGSCTAMASTTVTITALTPPNVPADYVCTGHPANLTVTNGPYSSYTWSNGMTGSSIQVTDPGNYTVTVTDANGCEATATVPVLSQMDPVVDITGDDQICPNGFTNLMATAGYDVYQWSPTGGANGSNYTVTAPGTYSVTVTDDLGCMNETTFTVTQAPAPQPMITGELLLCQGETTTLDAGSGFSTYQWSSNEQTQQIVVTTPGQYSVTVTGAGNCPGTDMVTVSVVPPPTPTISGNLTVCQNETTVLTANPGYDSYQWSTNDSGPSITAPGPGNYTVTVTNADGCEGTASVTVTQAESPAPSVTGDLAICPGETTTLTAPGGFNSYLWSNNETGTAITVSAPGSYSVTVTNAEGCEGVATVTVTEDPTPMPGISGTADFCPGGQASVSVSPAFDAYLWSDNSTGPNLVTSVPGSYMVTVTNSQGCTGTASVTINELTPPSPTITGDADICAGSSTTLDAGAGYSSYNWSTSATSQQVDVSSPGTYSVTVTDANGCEGVDQFTVTQLSNPAPVITGDLTFCEGTGATLTADAGYDDYLWSTGDTGPALTVTTPGNYTVSVTDANGCTGMTSVTVTMFDVPVVTIGGTTSLCPGGSAILDAGPGFSTYLWSNNATGQLNTVNGPGPYSVTVTDANGCEATATVDVTELAPPQPVITGDLTFCADQGGALDAGPGFASYEWSTGSTNQVLGVNTSGTYQVTVTDANGCEGVDAVTVTASPDPEPVIQGPTSICPEGSAVLDAGPGFATYLWSDGSSDQTLTVSNGGNYSVTVTLAGGCSGEASATVTILDPQDVMISGELSYCDGTNTVLTAGSGFVDYNWSNGGQDPSLTVDAPGDYTVVATDADGCTSEATVTVTEDPVSAPQINGLLSFCTGDNTLLDAGAGFVAYEWSDGGSGQTILVDQPGAYQVTVTNAAGCTGADTVAVTEVPELEPVITGDLEYCDGASTVLDAGGGYASYLWSDGATTQTLTAATPGNYSVTVTDANGCAGDATVAVEENALPAPAIDGADEYCAGDSTVLSANINYASYLWSDGSDGLYITVDSPGDYGLTVTDANGCENNVTLTVTENPVVPPPIDGALSFCEGDGTTLTGGNGYSLYEWSTGDMGPALDVTTGGSYTLTTTDANGCVSSTTVDVTEFDVTAPQITGDNAFCSGESVTLDAGGSYDTYVWQDGSTGQTVDVSNGGTYAVTVTDPNGCESSDTYQVTENPLPQVTIGGSTSYCIGGSTSLNAGAGYAGYLWSDSSATQTLTVNAPGDYGVTVTDNNGCVGSGLVTVSEDTELNPVVTGAQAYCAGGSTVLDAGDGYATYQWSDSSGGQTLTVDQPGSYAVTVTDANGCVGDTVVAVVENVLPQPQITGELDYCAGASTVLDAGPGYNNYFWEDSSGTATLTVSQPGDYSVTVTDANGCQNSDQVSVAETPLPQPQITGELAYCAGLTTSLDAGTGYVDYAWTGAVNSQALVVDMPGNYGVTVTDANGCQGDDLVTVVENPLPDPAITGELEYCAGLTTSLDAGAGYTAYLWNDNSSTQTLTVGAPGDYSVTVTDSNGCENGTSVAVAETPLPQPQITGELDFCAGSSTLLSAGTGYDAYQWSINSSSVDLVVSAPGDYGVTVTDVNGCQNSDLVTVVENPLPEPEITGAFEFCEGESTSLSLTAGYLAYAWTGGGQDTVLTVDEPGIYGVTVTDANGCSNDDQIEITQNPLPEPQIAGLLEYCEGENTTLEVAAGFIDYLWTGGDMTEAVIVESPGDYGVTVTDVNGCENSDQVTVVENALPAVSITGEPDFCAGENTTLSAGTGYMSYEWSDGSTEPTLVVDSPGNYSVLVVGTNGCQNTAELTAVENPLPQFTIDGTDFFCEESSTTLTATGNYAQYVWSDDVAGNSNEVDQPGTYIVTATSQEGCTSEEMIDIAEIAPPTADAGQPLDLTCTVSSVSIGGSGTTQGGVTYEWEGPGISPGQEGELFPEVTQAGIYTLTVIDNQYGCVSEPSVVTVTNLAYEPAVVLQINDILDCVTPSVTLDGQGSETGPSIVYNWYDAGGQLVADDGPITFEADQSQVYTLEVLDTETGCVSETSAELTQDIETPVAEAGQPDLLTCVVTSLSLDGTGSSEDPVMSYTWTTSGGAILSGSGTLMPVVNEPGVYQLEVLNTENGCTATDVVEVGQDVERPNAVAGEDKQLDCHTTEVNLTSAGSSVGPIYEYEWLTDGGAALVSTETNPLITEPGTYFLQITNQENGCVAIDEVVVTEIGDFPVDMSLTFDGPTCFGDLDAGIVVEEVEGGITPLVFSLNGAPFTGDRFFTGLGSGEYTIVVQDATGCELEAEVLIPPANDVQIDLGDDETIRIGETVQLFAEVNLTAGQIAGFSWSSRDSLTCPQCFEQTVGPRQTTDYSATVVDTNGCVATDVVTVFVENPQEVYVPSAFSPNGDGANDVFMVFAGDDVAVIKSFLVFNRWGEVVFEVYNFPPNDENYGWNGVFRGTIYNSAVFTWYTQVEFIDGQTKLFKGDVTLVR